MLKKLIAPVVIAGALLGGAAGAASAGAATPAPATATVTPTAKSAHPHGTRARKHRRQIRRAALAISAKTLGMTPKALAAELRSGKSIAQVAGGQTQAVINALVSAGDARVAKAVSNHKLTAAQGAKITAALPGDVNKAVNHVF